MSSPMAKTSGSRRISSRMAAMVASVKVCNDIGVGPLAPARSPACGRGGADSCRGAFRSEGEGIKGVA